MLLKHILRKLRCQYYFVLNRWSWIHPMYGTPYIVAEYICRRCNKAQLITLKNADAAPEHVLFLRYGGENNGAD